VREVRGSPSRTGSPALGVLVTVKRKEGSRWTGTVSTAVHLALVAHESGVQSRREWEGRVVR